MIDTGRPFRKVDYLEKQLGMSVPELFSLGNYQVVVEKGEESLWQTYAAMGLMGLTQRAVEGLKGFDLPEARFYSAIASWIDCDDGEAERKLAGIDTRHARNLLALIRKPKIKVLSQVWETESGSWGMISGIEKDPRFVIKQISPKPFANIHEHYDRQALPDFYVAAQAEWHLIPPNIREAPFPIICQTGDPDVHVQVVVPWLRLFDEVVTTAYDEWDDAAGLSGRPTSVFPKLFSIKVPQPHLNPFKERIHDVTITGAWFHPYQREKARIMRQILNLRGIEVNIFDGYLKSALYLDILARSKVIVSFSRYTGCLPSRGLESLSMGCATVIPKGNVWRHFVNEDDGVFLYDPYGDDLPEVIAGIVGGFEQLKHRLRLGSDKVRAEFNRHRVASQYFRYLAFLAAKPREDRRAVSLPLPAQKKLCYWRGGYQEGKNTIQLLKKEVIKRSTPDPRGIIDVARELGFEAVRLAEANLRNRLNEAPLFAVVSRVLKLYRFGLKVRPSSLVMRFNFIRIALHLGSRNQVDQGVEVLADTLDRAPSVSVTDLFEDIYPYDFFSHFMNYRQYFDLVTHSVKHSVSVNEVLKDLILASMFHYLGHYKDAADNFSKAVRLDPEFCRYRYSLARALMKTGDARSLETARNLLIDLAEESWLLVESYQHLEESWPDAFSGSKRLQAIAAAAALAPKAVPISSHLHPFDVWAATPLQEGAEHSLLV